jgi:sugar phosphate isomerase/epimerase
MKLAVSNIAWPVEFDSAAFEFLARNGISGVEVAPTRVWPHWQGIGSRAVGDLRRLMDSAGLVVSSLQAILFQKPEIRLFGSEQDRRAMREHLRFCADLAASLGAGCLVFGAPKNRDRGPLNAEDAFTIAAEFFAKVGEDYASRAVCLGFEANPSEYGCNFVTESRTAARLVRAVASEGFRLHLDTACLHLAGESVTQAIEDNSDILRHFHVSEPHLGSFETPVSEHVNAAVALKNTHFDGWAAIEMRPVDPPLPAMKQAANYVRGVYGD